MMSPDVKKRLLKVLQQAMRHEMAETFFNEPVDAVALGIPDYHDVIKQPMDLGTVLSKAQQGAYPDAAAAFEDVRLIWRNCRAYNEADSDVGKGCDELAGYVDQLWRQARLERAPAGSPSMQPVGGPVGSGMVPDSALYGGSFGGGGGFGGSVDGFGPGPGMLPGFVPQDGPIGAQNLGWGQPTLQQGGQPATPGSPPGNGMRGGGRGRGRGSAGKDAGKPPIRGGKGRGNKAGTAGGKPALMQKCLEVLQQVMSMPQATPFSQPLDIAAGGQPPPADLSTIAARVAAGSATGWGAAAPYSAPGEVLADVWALWEHCRASPRMNDSMLVMLDSMESTFHAAWSRAGLGDDSPAAPNALKRKSTEGLRRGSSGGSQGRPGSERRPKKQRSMKELQSDGPRRGGRKAAPALSAAAADELRAMDSVDLGGLPELDDFEPGLAFDSLLDGPSADEGRMANAAPPQQQMSAALAMQRQQQAEQAQAQALYNARLQPQMLARGGQGRSAESPTASAGTPSRGGRPGRADSGEWTPGGGTPTARCDVCARAKKGRCGTATAPFRCRRRPALGLPTSPRAARAADSGSEGDGAGPNAGPQPLGGSPGGMAPGDARFQARFAHMQQRLGSPGEGGASPAADGGRAAQAQALQQEMRGVAQQQHALEQRYTLLVNELQRVQAARQALPDAARAAESAVRQFLELQQQAVQYQQQQQQQQQAAAAAAAVQQPERLARPGSSTGQPTAALHPSVQALGAHWFGQGAAGPQQGPGDSLLQGGPQPPQPGQVGSPADVQRRPPATPEQLQASRELLMAAARRQQQQQQQQAMQARQGVASPGPADQTARPSSAAAAVQASPAVAEAQPPHQQPGMPQQVPASPGVGSADITPAQLQAALAEREAQQQASFQAQVARHEAQKAQLAARRAGMASPQLQPPNPAAAAQQLLQKPQQQQDASARAAPPLPMFPQQLPQQQAAQQLAAQQLTSPAGRASPAVTGGGGPQRPELSQGAAGLPAVPMPPPASKPSPGLGQQPGPPQSPHQQMQAAQQQQMHAMLLAQQQQRAAAAAAAAAAQQQHGGGSPAIGSPMGGLTPQQRHAAMLARSAQQAAAQRQLASTPGAHSPGGQPQGALPLGQQAPMGPAQQPPQPPQPPQPQQQQHPQQRPHLQLPPAGWRLSLAPEQQAKFAALPLEQQQQIAANMYASQQQQLMAHRQMQMQQQMQQAQYAQQRAAAAAASQQQMGPRPALQQQQPMSHNSQQALHMQQMLQAQQAQQQQQQQQAALQAQQRAQAAASSLQAATQQQAPPQPGPGPPGGASPQMPSAEAKPESVQQGPAALAAGGSAAAVSQLPLPTGSLLPSAAPGVRVAPAAAAPSVAIVQAAGTPVASLPQQPFALAADPAGPHVTPTLGQYARQLASPSAAAAAAAALGGGPAASGSPADPAAQQPAAAPGQTAAAPQQESPLLPGPGAAGAGGGRSPAGAKPAGQQTPAAEQAAARQAPPRARHAASGGAATTPSSGDAPSKTNPAAAATEQAQAGADAEAAAAGSDAAATGPANGTFPLGMPAASGAEATPAAADGDDAFKVTPPSRRNATHPAAQSAAQRLETNDHAAAEQQMVADVKRAPSADPAASNAAIANGSAAAYGSARQGSVGGR